MNVRRQARQKGAYARRVNDLKQWEAKLEGNKDDKGLKQKVNAAKTDIENLRKKLGRALES